MNLITYMQILTGPQPSRQGIGAAALGTPGILGPRMSRQRIGHQLWAVGMQVSHAAEDDLHDGAPRGDFQGQGPAKASAGGSGGDGEQHPAGAMPEACFTMGEGIAAVL